MKIIFYQILLLLLTANLTFSQVKSDSLKKRTTAAGRTSLLELQRDLDAVLDIPELKDAFYGIAFFSLESGEYIYKKNENYNFIPASLVKLITTTAGLNYLSEDFRYSTGLYLNGYLANTGEYFGDIIIRGAGDPTFSKNFYSDPAERINKFAYILDSLGIKSISGNIIGDDNYFDDEYYGANRVKTITL